jgi:hypothetical protein
MPAIQLARLKIQAEELSAKAGSPVEFCRELHALLDYYADRAYRPGKTGQPPPLLKSYHVSPPVMRQILSSLQPFIAREQQGTLELSDALWSESYYELRMLAVSLLGQVSLDPPEPILERFTSWANPSVEKRLIRILIETGLARLRREQRQRYLDEATARLMDSSEFVQQLGLQFLEPVVTAQDFEDYPAITRLLTPILRSGSTLLRHDLLRLTQALAKKSPKETAFYLRQNLVYKQNNLNTTWLIRHTLADFPPENQEYLREGLREGI